jgi:hypothetical protein
VLSYIVVKATVGTHRNEINLVTNKSTRNSGKQWTRAEVNELRALAKQNTPTRVIGLKLGRSENAVRTKASEEGISLKPTNQSPYGTRNIK